MRLPGDWLELLCEARPDGDCRCATRRVLPSRQHNEAVGSVEAGRGEDKKETVARRRCLPRCHGVVLCEADIVPVDRVEL